MIFPRSTSLRTQGIIATMLLTAATMAVRADNPTFTVTPQTIKPDRAAGVLRIHVNPASVVNTGPQTGDPPVIGLRDVAVELAKWYNADEAAGNHGDLYDNRDRGHSMMKLDRFPQFTKVVYSPPLRQKNIDYGVQVQLLYDRPVLGNSSTAMTQGPMWRSNPRRCYVDGRAMALLHQQYTNNNLYLYPEHRDYDPGHNGIGGGYGDAYPTNTPYVLISQGSSGSDRVFMEAVAATMAAFRPDVKRTLIEHGMLMPTVQMILRWCNDGVSEADEYLTGKAHPPVFDGKLLRRRAMVDMAHAITSDDIPPMVRLAVADETPDRPGVDYFESGPAQRLATTPQAIARVHRTLDQNYRITLSAASSSDLNDRPLTYHWVVLRGDADAISIKPINDDRSLVVITVPWHERRPIAPGSDMQSNRVDIGVFVNNGAYYSAPAFYTVHTLDDERRTYDDNGKLIEVDYTATDVDLRVTDWVGLLHEIASPSLPGPKLLHEQMAGDQRALLVEVAEEYTRLNQDVAAAEADLKVARQSADEASQALKKIQKDGDTGPNRQADLEAARTTQRAAQKASKQASKHRDEVTNTRDAVLTQPRPLLANTSVQSTVTSLLNALLNHPSLAIELDDSINQWVAEADDSGVRNSIRSARDRLITIGLIEPGSPPRLTPVRQGEQPVQQRLLPYERAQLQRFNSVVLRSLMFKKLVDVKFVANYVDPMIASHRTWRDVYRYTPQGQRLGWTRYPSSGAPQEFTADGARVLATDKLDRPTRARTVKYELAPVKSPARRTMVQEQGDQIFEYTYDGPKDAVGRISNRQTDPSRP
ncbi:hypothetical protein HED60_22165 [Planctomycetales bacterium ZRK34]|nr:hypothetical protein HED60_22165 [Planctomycetales bacterium ZRK34]